VGEVVAETLVVIKQVEVGQVMVQQGIGKSLGVSQQ